MKKALILILISFSIYAQEEGTSFSASSVKMKMHKENYVYPFFRSTPNQRDARHANEFKYQISLKLTLLNTEFSSLNVGYTQKSFWQVYDSRNSRPFRETNYNPELFYRLGSKTIFLDLGYEHESNGEKDPVSRSWDRAYLKFYIQSPRFRVAYKVWTIVDEERYGELYEERDRSMKHYYGNQELELGVQLGKLVLKVSGRYNYSSRRGYIEALAMVPISKTVLFGLTHSNGYGNNLRAYNRKHDTIGLGFLLNP